MKLTRTIALLLLPLLVSACAVRQLADGSWTTCKVGQSCQVGPHSGMTQTPAPMMHHKHHHMMKKAAVVKKKTTTTTTTTTTPSN